jgi:hypothetical protein
MTAELLASHADASVYHADWRALLDVVRDAGGCDLLCVDAPYSWRTHLGHDEGVADVGERRALNYRAWGSDDVYRFCEEWRWQTRGWFVSITDHVLARAWTEALEATDRYVFAPIPFYSPGSRVRLCGDGPSCWTTWIIVARPRKQPFTKWGTLPGGYAGASDRQKGETWVVGGKPLWLMEALVRDYSRPGDLVVDPFCGAGTTLVAAQRNGRRSIGGDAMREHAELAAKRISKPAQQPLFGGAA